MDENSALEWAENSALEWAGNSTLEWADNSAQTVTVIRNTNWQKVISNPHPDAYCAGSSFQKES